MRSGVGPTDPYGPSPPGHDRIVMSHGGGGELTSRLIRDHLLRVLGNEWLDPLTDAAVLGPCDGPLVITTDSFVVQPIEFPGGDIGRLAVCGTVNDLAMMGAMPVGLTLGLILEEGLPLERLARIIQSIGAAAHEAQTRIVTGDTKVIERRGNGDGLLINTAGLGRQLEGVNLSTRRIQVGDAVMISGRIAEHGLAVMSRREGLEFASSLVSDVAPLNALVRSLFATGADIRFLRDPTRGGLAGVLADISSESGLSLEIEERAVPISPSARHAAEILGLDPLAVANEGKLVAVAAAHDVERLLAACRAHPLGVHASVIGRVTDAQPPLAELITEAGGRRIIQKPYGEDLPRIC